MASWMAASFLCLGSFRAAGAVSVACPPASSRSLLRCLRSARDALLVASVICTLSYVQEGHTGLNRYHVCGTPQLVYAACSRTGPVLVAQGVAGR